MSLAVPYEDRTLRVVTDGPLVVTAWFDTPQPEHLRALTRTAETLFLRMRGQKHVLVNTLVGGNPAYSEEMRRLTADAGRKMAAWRAATAHVILFGGLRGVIARSITSTVLLLSRSKAPTKVFDSFGSAGPWVISHLPPGEDWNLQRLSRACDIARSADMDQRQV